MVLVHVTNAGCTPLSLPALTGHGCPPCKRRPPSSALRQPPSSGPKDTGRLAPVAPAHGPSDSAHLAPRCAHWRPARGSLLALANRSQLTRATPLGPRRRARGPPSSSRADVAELWGAAAGGRGTRRNSCRAHSSVAPPPADGEQHERSPRRPHAPRGLASGLARPRVPRTGLTHSPAEASRARGHGSRAGLTYRPPGGLACSRP